MTGEHVGSIEEEFTEDEFIAGCSCGWAGPVRGTRALAQLDLEQHYGLIGA